MNENHRAELARLRGMTSNEVADELLSKYPLGSPQCSTAHVLIGHLSFKPADQRRLAFHYLSNIPHAAGHAYRAFAQMMALPAFLQIIEAHWPEDSDLGLLFYHLAPALREVGEERGQGALVEDWLARVRSPPSS